MHYDRRAGVVPSTMQCTEMHVRTSTRIRFSFEGGFSPHARISVMFDTNLVFGTTRQRLGSECKLLAGFFAGQLAIFTLSSSSSLEIPRRLRSILLLAVPILFAV